MPRFIEEGWALRAGAPLLEYAAFMPNHASIGQYNALLFKGIEAVETGRLEPKDAATFVVEELQAELGDDVIILE
jgi:inositol-phosphate transport system substrate-binding protein